MPPKIPSKNIDNNLILVNIKKVGEYIKLNKNAVHTPAHNIQVNNFPKNLGSNLFIQFLKPSNKFELVII